MRCDLHQSAYREVGKRTPTAWRGLTMVEMLVVIAICGVMAALLVPVLLVSREKARTIVCADNLRNVGVAFSTIMPVQEGYFTNGFYDVTALGPNEWWIGPRDQWDGNDPLVVEQGPTSFLCPSARGSVNVVKVRRSGNVVQIPTSYAYNIEMPIIARNLSRVENPARRVLLYDGDASAVVGNWDHTLAWPDKTILPRHRGKANFLFLDGHVEADGGFRVEPMHACEWGRMFTGAAQGSTAPLEEGVEFDGNIDGALMASLNLLPVSNNLKNKGNQLQGTLRISGGNGAMVDTGSILLLGVANHALAHPLPAVPPISQSLTGEDGIVCQVKFDRQLLYDQLLTGKYWDDNVPVKVVGMMSDGRAFEAVDYNTFFIPPKN